jgi:hypothetical protein
MNPAKNAPSEAESLRAAIGCLAAHTDPLAKHPMGAN